MHMEWHIGDSHPDRARNRIVKKFLDSGREWLLFLDADLKFNPNDILKLYSHGKDIMCGFYARKQIGPARWVANALTNEKTPEGFQVLREAGTGCMLINRKVIDAIIKAYPETQYTTDPKGDETEWAVFASGPVYDAEVGRRRWLSEDWLFCHRARACGFDILGDTSVILLHEGPVMYPIPQDKEETEK